MQLFMSINLHVVNKANILLASDLLASAFLPPTSWGIFFHFRRFKHRKVFILCLHTTHVEKRKHIHFILCKLSFGGYETKGRKISREWMKTVFFFLSIAFSKHWVSFFSKPKRFPRQSSLSFYLNLNVTHQMKNTSNCR